MQEGIESGWVKFFVDAVMDALKDYVPAGGKVHFEMELGVQMMKEQDGYVPYVVPLKQGDEQHRIQFDAVMPGNKESGDGAA